MKLAWLTAHSSTQHGGVNISWALQPSIPSAGSLLECCHWTVTADHSPTEALQMLLGLVACSRLASLAVICMAACCTWQRCSSSVEAAHTIRPPCWLPCSCQLLAGCLGLCSYSMWIWFAAEGTLPRKHFQATMHTHRSPIRLQPHIQEQAMPMLPLWTWSVCIVCANLWLVAEQLPAWHHCKYVCKGRPDVGTCQAPSYASSPCQGEPASCRVSRNQQIVVMNQAGPGPAIDRTHLEIPLRP